MFASMSSTVSLPYSVIIFLEVTTGSLSMVVFSPASIHPDGLALYDIFSLNRFNDFYSLSNSFGSFIIELLKKFIPVVEV